MASTKRGGRGKRQQPVVRSAIPQCDVEHLTDALAKYVAAVGVLAAFVFWEYQGIKVSCAAVGAALLQMEQLLNAVLKVVPWAEVTYGNWKLHLIGFAKISRHHEEVPWSSSWCCGWRYRRSAHGHHETYQTAEKRREQIR